MPDRSLDFDASDLKVMANAIRMLTVDAVDKAKSGHQGMPMGMADVATVLFTRFLKYDAAAPEWPDRDRFVLSAGHGSMLLYSLLHLTGSPDISMEDIKAFRQFGSKTAGHPEFGHVRGIETTTGPLGQGFGNAVGMAIAEAHLVAAFGPSLVDHFTYVMASDGDLMEGISQEAAALAGHLKLNKLIVLFDDNSITIDGPRSLSDSVDQVARFKAMGWHTDSVDGHDPEAVAAAIERAQKSDAPSLIACRTIIGFGAPAVQGTSAAHGNAIKGDEIAALREKLGWPYPPFEIPEAVLSAWRAAGSRGRDARASWEARLGQAPATTRDEFLRRMKGEVPQAAFHALTQHAHSLAKSPQKMATRKASGVAIEAIAEHCPELVGGSADLSGSNNTKTKALSPFTGEDGAGRYLYFGIREHGMAAALNGMALHGGVIPYGGTFLVFSDYARPSIRLAALMGIRTIFVMTHDSIGVGEDGPTHQPIEHLAALRAIPNLTVFRPADAVETAECWELALRNEKGPSLLALTRQDLPPLRTNPGDNLTARGGYLLSPADGTAKVTLIGTGSEVQIALEAQKLLAEKGVAAGVVSMPSTSLFDAQDEAYRRQILPPDTVKIAVEAASSLGWHRYTGETGGVLALDHFGASAPYGTLYKEFGLTAERLAALALSKLG